MSQIPRPALILGFAGLLPFLFFAIVASGLLSADMGNPADGGYSLLARGDGQTGLVSYGIVIACFMSGVLWGFATQATERMWTVYMLSVVPALWVFFFVVGPTGRQLSALIVGFILVLVIDIQFRAWRLVPGWWLSLRLPLTLIVILCLSIGLLA